MYITTRKHKISPFVAGLRCELLERGYFEQTHYDWQHGDTILRYDLKIKMPSGMVTFANSEWFEEDEDCNG